MRKITGTQIAAFELLLAIVLVAASGSTWLIGRAVPPGDFRGVMLVAVFILVLYLCAFAVYRAFLRVLPLPEGPIVAGTRGEFTLQVNTLFYLILFYPLTRSNVVPVPLMRLVYQALGARLGANTYSGGALLDPPLTIAGANCIIGHGAVVFAHAIEGSRMSLSRVVLGDSVTIGAMAVVMSDVRIGDGAIVSAGAVVLKGSRIGAGEVWGGVPARCIGAAPGR